MTSLAWVVLVAAGMYAFHRVALRMEARGWIYYQKKRGSSGALSSAALEVQSMFEPSTRYVLKERRKEDIEEQESGDPPAPGNGVRH